MGYIEDLRKQREAEEARVREARTSRTYEEIKAEQDAKKAAFQSSAISSVISEIRGADPSILRDSRDSNQGKTLADFKNPALGMGRTYEVKGLRVDPENGVFKPDTHEITQEFTIEGQVDGSVRIGGTVLSPDQARDHDAVESAIGSVIEHLQKPIHTSAVVSPAGDFGQDEHGTGWGMGGF